jgi:rhodanese-related sulfurtransferase
MQKPRAASQGAPYISQASIYIGRRVRAVRLLTSLRRILMAVFIIDLLASPMLLVGASPCTNVDVNTAYNMITSGTYPNLVILDVRTKSEYDSGHIYGATLIPVTDLIARIGELAGHENDPILVYCKSGGRSTTAAGILCNSYDFTRVYNMTGGITAWIAAGFPTWIGTVHNINTTFNYDTIQAAIDSSLTTNGNMIVVDKGTYYEHVIVSKALSIVGEDSKDTVIDGNGTGTTISIVTDNVTVENFTIQNGTESGVDLNGGSYAQIHDNKVTHNYCGINASSSYNMIFSNEIVGNEQCGVSATQGANRIFENNITSNQFGVQMNGPETSNPNYVYHNNLMNNTSQVSAEGVSSLWDDGYPSGGNYWSDYNGTDLYSGPYQNETGSDGLGDTPYTINPNNTDRCPLSRPWLWGPRYLTIVPAQGGTTSPPPGNYEYNTTSYVEVTSVADDRYTFDRWELDGCNATNTGKIGIRTDTNHTLKAVFAQTRYTLEITPTPEGNTNPAAGSYAFEPYEEALVSAEADPGYYLDRWELDGVYIGIPNPASIVMNSNHTLYAVFKPLDIGHNVATKWIDSKTVVGQSFNISIKVTIMNTGSYTENVNVTAHLDLTSITLENVALDSGAFTTLTFTVNTSGLSKGNYTLWAYSWPILEESYLEDNNFTGGLIMVSMVGDLTGAPGVPWPGLPDGKVDGKDLTLIAKCFGSWPEAPPPMTWNPNADINNDGKVDGKDLTALAKHFGQSDP